MTATASASAQAPPIPLAEATALLRQLGVALLGSVVRCEPPPTLAKLLSRRDIALLLPYAGQRHAVPFTWLTLRPWMRQAAWWAVRGWRSSWAPPDLRAGLGRAVHSGLRRGAPDRRWRMLAGLWVDRMIGGVTGRWLAEPFWGLAAELAWGDARFQAEATQMILAELRKRVFFSPGEPPTPTIGLRTCWALIALADSGAPPLWRRRATRLGLGRLRRTAAQAILVPGWADVWDQWLISEALRLWPGSDERLDPATRAAMLSLPIHTYLHPQQVDHEPPGPPAPDLAAAGWAQRTPPWLATLARWEREPIIVAPEP